jgi:hypothetical protein
MARPLCIDLKNGSYHVTNRSHSRQAIYLDNRKGRQGTFLTKLKSYTSRCGPKHMS